MCGGSILVNDSAPMLRVANLSAFYGELQALQDVSFDIRADQVVSIIGANGAGKSTLLKSLVGQMRRGRTAHITGEISFAGSRIDALSPAEIVDRGIAMVPEGRRLFARMSVEDNLLAGAFLPRCRGTGRQRLETVYALFPRLAERRRQLVAQMSGGEQQMVAIGRAMMSEPRLILFDELSLGLAPAVINDIYASLDAIRASHVACVIVEQNMKRSLAVATDVLVMLEGRIVLRGRPDELTEAAVAAAYFGAREAAA